MASLDVFARHLLVSDVFVSDVLCPTPFSFRHLVSDNTRHKDALDALILQIVGGCAVLFKVCDQLMFELRFQFPCRRHPLVLV